MAAFWWMALACALCGAAALIFYWKRPASSRASVAVLQQTEPSLPPTYNSADDIQIVREQNDSFQVISNGNIVLYLSTRVAVQVHRWLCQNGCSCNCMKDESALLSPLRVVERDGKLFYKTDTDLPGNQIFEVPLAPSSPSPKIWALRDDNNATIALDKSACDKIHVLLRPRSCQCGCLEIGLQPVPIRVS